MKGLKRIWNIISITTDIKSRNVFKPLTITENEPDLEHYANNSIVDYNSIRMASERIKPFIHKTPIFTSQYMNKLTGRNLFFKCENFQKTGSFKFRGATNIILRLKELYKFNEFIAVTVSSGNMGQAVSLAATQQNIKSVIIVHRNCSKVKKEAMKSYGSTIIEYSTNRSDEDAVARPVLKEIGERGVYILCNPFIIEGQGTIGLEMMQQIPYLNAIVVCSGTGAVTSGIAIAAKAINPRIKVYAAEPQSANSIERSLNTGKRYLFEEFPTTIAEGLKTNLRSHSWDVIKDYVDGSITASEEEIKEAMFLIWQRMKIIVEPSGATATAAVLSSKFHQLPKELKNIGVLVSGGNIDLKNFSWKE